MKKNWVMLLSLVLLVLPLVSSMSLEMKDSFGQEETLMAKISGDLISPPLRENIFLYRGHVKVAIDAYVAKINEDYYIYAPLSGKAPLNYSLVIKGIEYTKGTKKISEDLIKNFTVREDYAPFAITPGFVVSKNDFTITLENFLDDDLELT
ncbi:MAG TPA: hypothetical protein VJ438_03510, partial [Candidatus Nanoarchaeia archaeon]|nr:hypothetical protein [Candidatus Nanoarchaeia archaeon]